MARPSGGMLLCTDALAFLAAYPFRGDELVYCDPPYLPSTRRRRKVYRFELSEEQHAELLHLLRSLPCKVVISGYPSALYAAMLKDWSYESFQSRTHKTWATENVWFNFPKPGVLHDARFLGSDFRERHTIRRRLQRLQRRLQSLSPSEQGELLVWLSEELRSRHNAPNHCGISR
jgi:hypothetical protein